VATGLAVDDDNRLTGRYRGGNCRGEEKVRRLRTWIDEAGATPDRLWAYGNSRGDVRMLRAADVGINVGRLGALGRLRDFPGLDRTGPNGN
jgi:phosphatidylglycerophosphatase C